MSFRSPIPSREWETSDEISSSPEGISLFLRELYARKLINKDELENISRLVEQYGKYVTAQERSALEQSQEMIQFLEKRCEQLRSESATLTDDYMRMERESSNSAQFQRVIGERTAEINRLSVALASQKAIAIEAIERLKLAEERIKELEIDLAQLDARCAKMQLTSDGAVAQSQTLALEKASLIQTLDKVSSERESWIRESSRITTQMTSDLSSAVRVREKLTKDYQSLMEEMECLKLTLESRDQTIVKLQDCIEEKGMLLESYRIKCSRDEDGFQGSIMNEIEELVQSQRITGGSQSQDQNHTHTSLSFLENLLPRITQTHNTLEEEESSASSVDKTSSLILGSLQSTPPDSDCSCDIDPFQSSETTQSYLKTTERIHPITANLDSANVFFPFSSATMPSDVAIMHLLPSQPVQASSNQLDSQKLSDCITLYAGATQHLAGVKIAQGDKVKLMSVDQLRQIEMVLRELIHSRSEKLIEVLAERDMLRHEIDFKLSVLSPIVSKIQDAADAAANEQSPPEVPASTKISKKPIWGLGNLLKRKPEVVAVAPRKLEA